MKYVKIQDFLRQFLLRPNSTKFYLIRPLIATGICHHLRSRIQCEHLFVLHERQGAKKLVPRQKKTVHKGIANEKSADIMSAFFSKKKEVSECLSNKRLCSYASKI